MLGPFADPLDARRRRQRVARLEAEARARPHDERVLLGLADAHRQSGHFEEAVQRYWQAAQLYVGACHYVKALAVIQNALELQPEAFFLRRGAAQTLERLGRNLDAAQAYRAAAAIAERRGRGPDAEHLRGRADMLAPPKGRRPTIVRDLEPPEALPPSPLAEALSAPAGGSPLAASAPPEPSDGPEPAAAEAPEGTPLPEILREPELPPARPGQVPQANDAPRTKVQIPRAGPRAPDTGPDVPILQVRSASEVDAIVAKEMARAFGDEVVEAAGAHGPAVEALAQEAATQAKSTELALDAELFLLAHDPAEAATAQCSAHELDQIKTRTLISQAERELQSLLTNDDAAEATVEQELFDPLSSYV